MIKNTYRIGSKKISPKKIRDGLGNEGIFLSNEDWKTVQSAIPNIATTKTAKKKNIKSKQKTESRKSLMPGIRLAFKEIRDDLSGTKPLPNATEDPR